MSKDKKDFYNIAELTAAFDALDIPQDRNYFLSAAMLAQAQQASVLSGRFSELQAQLDGMGKSLRSIAVSLDKIANAIKADAEDSNGKT
jgi:hypothetical protein